MAIVAYLKKIQLFGISAYPAIPINPDMWSSSLL